MATPRLERIFCIIDPTSNHQRALARPVSIAAEAQAAIHTYISVHIPDDIHHEGADEVCAAERILDSVDADVLTVIQVP